MLDHSSTTFSRVRKGDFQQHRSPFASRSWASLGWRCCFDESRPLCISMAVSQKDLFWKSWDFFRVIFKCLIFFFSSSLRFIYGWQRVWFGHKSYLQTSCSKLSSGSATCHGFCIRLHGFLFLWKHLKFRHGMEGTQLSLQCGSTSVKQLGAILLSLSN